MTTPELTRIVQQERERDITRDRLARIAACARACCDASLTARISRALRLTPTAC